MFRQTYIDFRDVFITAFLIESCLPLPPGEFPKWRVRGFNLENATLKLGITETERSTDLTILHYNKVTTPLVIS